MCGEANSQSSGLPYGDRCLHAQSDSAVCASSGTSFRDASIFGAPSTIATTDRRICNTRFSKSTSCHRSPVGWFGNKVGHSRLRESFSQLLSCQSSSRLVLVLLGSPIHFELNLMNSSNESVWTDYLDTRFSL